MTDIELIDKLIKKSQQNVDKLCKQDTIESKFRLREALSYTNDLMDTRIEILNEKRKDNAHMFRDRDMERVLENPPF
jgi:hypothetical protein